jgi:hypothetical protein
MPFGSLAFALTSCRIPVLPSSFLAFLHGVFRQFGLKVSFSLQDFSSMPTLCRAVDDGGFGKNLNRVSKNEHATVLLL